MLTFASKIDVLSYASENSYLAEIFPDGKGGMLHGTLIAASYPFILTPEVKNVGKNILISLSGRAQAGKNSCSDAVKLLCGEMQSKYVVQELAFADELKSIAKRDYAWDGSKDVYPPEVTDKGRNLLIALGKKYRDMDKDYWVKIVAEKIENSIKEAQSNPKLFCISDTRYSNEIKVLRSLEKKYSNTLKVYCVRVARKDALNINDPSEHDLDNFFCWDTVINNNDTLQDLKERLSYFLSSIGVI